MSLTGLEGIILSEGVDFNPVGLQGIIFTFSEDTVFLRVTNGLGRPIEGMTVSTDYSGTTLTGFTDENGSIQILSDDTGTIRMQKEKTFQTLAFDRSTDGSVINYVFNVPLLE